MIYTMTDKVFIGGVVLLFFIALIQGGFMLFCLSMWIKSKKELKNLEDLMAIEREKIRATNEVHEWAVLLNEKDDKIRQLNSEIHGLKTKKSRTENLLKVSESERLKKEA